MIALVNYADERMTISQELCSQSSLKYGVDKVFQYGISDISNEFLSFNKEVFKYERGAGYWLWKPYVVFKAIDQLQDGDILIYSDSGCEWVNNVSHLVEAMDQDILFFSNGHQHVHWCKGDVLAAITGPINESYQQVQASIIVFKVNETTRRFVKEWLLWCQMPGFIDDSPSKLPNHPEFAEHRHDQAILTCMQIKYNYRLHWWPDKLWYESQRGRWPDDKYPSMVKHHRKRNNEWN